VARFTSDGVDSDEYRWLGAKLPTGLTDELRLRMRVTGGEANDDWYADDFRVASLTAIGVPWIENFESPTNTTFVWPTFGATRSSAASATGTYSGSLPGGQSMQTGPIDTSAFTGGGDAYVSFAVRGSSLGSGQTLTAEVKDAAGVWQTMAILTDAGVSGSSFKTTEADFDAAWVSADFEVRLTSSAGAGAWLIDNVYVGPTSYADGGCNAADVNADGVLNLDDVNLFASSFASGSLVADVDGNGVLNLDDVNVFAGAFITGCP
ncbi:MAG: GC-type dockerin domain-anchored protein, partial [Phycisphaerales bacterium]